MKVQPPAKATNSVRRKRKRCIGTAHGGSHIDPTRPHLRGARKLSASSRHSFCSGWANRLAFIKSAGSICQLLSLSRFRLTRSYRPSASAE